MDHLNGLRVIARYPHNSTDPSFSAIHLITQPLWLCHGVPNTPPQLADPRGDGDSLPPEETLCLRKVSLIDDQDTFSMIWLENPQGGAHHDVVQMGKYSLKDLPDTLLLVYQGCEIFGYA